MVGLRKKVLAPEEQGMLGHALWLRSKGLFVIPLCWPAWESSTESWVCGCGHCEDDESVGKRPLLEQSGQEHRADVAQLRLWWQRWPQANIGILLQPSGLLVADVDSEEARQEARAMGILLTRIASTGQGLHYYYKCPEELREHNVWQTSDEHRISVLTGGYVVAPPSRHRSGQRYQWRGHHSTVRPPDWILKLLRLPLSDVVLSDVSDEEMQACESARTYQSPSNPTLEPVSDQDEELMVWEALGHIPDVDRDVWRRVGSALYYWDHRRKGCGRGRLLWDRWSAWRCPAIFAPETQRDTWHSFAADEDAGRQFLAMLSASEQMHKEHEKREWQRADVQVSTAMQEPIDTGMQRAWVDEEEEDMSSIVLFHRDHQQRESLLAALLERHCKVIAFGCSAAACQYLRSYPTNVVLWERQEREDEGAERALLEGFRRDGYVEHWLFWVEEVLEDAEQALSWQLSIEDQVTQLLELTTLIEWLRAGFLRLHPKEGRLLFRSEEIYLTELEFVLLEFLMQHKGKLVSFEALIQKIYTRGVAKKHMDIMGSLRQHISKLRRKLEQVGASGELIHNVRSRGYILRTTPPHSL